MLLMTNLGSTIAVRQHLQRENVSDIPTVKIIRGIYELKRLKNENLRNGSFGSGKTVQLLYRSQ